MTQDQIDDMTSGDQAKVEGTIQQPQLNPPSVESLEKFFYAVASALDLLRVENPTTFVPILYSNALSVLLQFPYQWSVQAQTTERFVEAITGEAQNLVALVALRDKQLAILNSEPSEEE